MFTSTSSINSNNVIASAIGAISQSSSNNQQADHGHILNRAISQRLAIINSYLKSKLSADKAIVELEALDNEKEIKKYVSLLDPEVLLYVHLPIAIDIGLLYIHKENYNDAIIKSNTTLPEAEGFNEEGYDCGNIIRKCYYLRALGYEKTKNFDLALADYQQGVEFEPNRRDLFADRITANLYIRIANIYFTNKYDPDKTIYNLYMALEILQNYKRLKRREIEDEIEKHENDRELDEKSEVKFTRGVALKEVEYKDASLAISICLCKLATYLPGNNINFQNPIGPVRDSFFIEDYYKESTEQTLIMCRSAHAFYVQYGYRHEAELLSNFIAGSSNNHDTKQAQTGIVNSPNRAAVIDHFLKILPIKLKVKCLCMNSRNAQEGQVYLNEGDAAEALRYYSNLHNSFNFPPDEQISSILPRKETEVFIDYTYGLQKLYTLLGRALLQNQQPKNALMCFNSVMSFMTSAKAYFGTARDKEYFIFADIQYYLGLAYEETKDSASATNYYQQAIDCLLSHGELSTDSCDTWSLVKLYEKIAIHYEKQPQLAIRYLDIALYFCRELALSAVKEIEEEEEVAVDSIYTYIQTITSAADYYFLKASYLIKTKQLNAIPELSKCEPAYKRLYPHINDLGYMPPLSIHTWRNYCLILRFYITNNLWIEARNIRHTLIQIHKVKEELDNEGIYYEEFSREEMQEPLLPILLNESSDSCATGKTQNNEEMSERAECLRWVRQFIHPNIASNDSNASTSSHISSTTFQEQQKPKASIQQSAKCKQAQLAAQVADSKKAARRAAEAAAKAKKEERAKTTKQKMTSLQSNVSVADNVNANTASASIISTIGTTKADLVKSSGQAQSASSLSDNIILPTTVEPNTAKNQAPVALTNDNKIEGTETKSNETKDKETKGKKSLRSKKKRRFKHNQKQSKAGKPTVAPSSSAASSSSSASTSRSNVTASPTTNSPTVSNTQSRTVATEQSKELEAKSNTQPRAEKQIAADKRNHATASSSSSATISNETAGIINLPPLRLSMLHNRATSLSYISNPSIMIPASHKEILRLSTARPQIFPNTQRRTAATKQEKKMEIKSNSDIVQPSDEKPNAAGNRIRTATSSSPATPNMTVSSISSDRLRFIPALSASLLTRATATDHTAASSSSATSNAPAYLTNLAKLVTPKHAEQARSASSPSHNTTAPSIKVESNTVQPNEEKQHLLTARPPIPSNTQSVAAPQPIYATSNPIFAVASMSSSSSMSASFSNRPNGANNQCTEKSDIEKLNGLKSFLACYFDVGQFAGRLGAYYDEGKKMSSLRQILRLPVGDQGCLLLYAINNIDNGQVKVDIAKVKEILKYERLCGLQYIFKDDRTNFYIYCAAVHDALEKNRSDISELIYDALSSCPKYVDDPCNSWGGTNYYSILFRSAPRIETSDREKLTCLKESLCNDQSRLFGDRLFGYHIPQNNADHKISPLRQILRLPVEDEDCLLLYAINHIGDKSTKINVPKIRYILEYEKLCGLQNLCGKENRVNFLIYGRAMFYASIQHRDDIDILINETIRSDKSAPFVEIDPCNPVKYSVS